MRHLRRTWAVALIAFLIGAVGVARATSYYGTPLRGFDSQLYYGAARSLVVSRTLTSPTTYRFPPARGFNRQLRAQKRSDGGVAIFPVGLSLLEAGLLLPARLLGFGNGPPVFPSWLSVARTSGVTTLASSCSTVCVAAIARLAMVVVLASWAGTPLCTTARGSHSLFIRPRSPSWSCSGCRGPSSRK